MPIIINEFEIVPEPAPTSAATLTEQPAAESDKTIPASEIGRLIKHLQERELRLWAH